MEKRSIEEIIRALAEGRVRYLIAGGLAVVAHGYLRFTADIDILLAMDKPNLVKAITALKSLNYRPRAPVDFEQLLDSNQRKQWIRQKGMTVFSLYSPDHPVTEIDIFIDRPLDFGKAYSKAVMMEVAPGLRGSFCSLEDLILLKSRAGRPRDLEDIEQLRKLNKDRK